MAVITGTISANIINGTSEDDTISGYDGNDTLSGMGGYDYLYGGLGADRISGNDGNDTILGAEGNDWIYGNLGNDNLVGEGGNDKLFGHNGADKLTGSAGNDSLDGGSGNDSLLGGDGDDMLTGGAGDDLLAGNAGADTFILGDGYDTLNDWNTSEGDKIDLTAALSQYNANTDNLSDFIKVVRTVGSASSTISIDANGLGDGVASFVNIALVKNSTYSSITAMIADGVVIVPQPTGAGTITFEETSGSADDFNEFLGVCVKNTESYSELTTITNALNYLNIGNIRAGASGSDPLYNELANEGFQFDFLMRRDGDTGGKALLDKYIKHFTEFLAAHPDSIKSIEGVNEFGNPSFSFDYEGLTGKEAVVQYQKDLYNGVNAEASLADIPVYNFTIFEGQYAANFTGFEDTSNYSDGATSHVYVNTNLQPYYEMQNRLSNSEILDTNSPNIVTELGYPSSEIQGNTLSVGEEAQAKLLLNQIMNAYDLGVESAYIYELFDKGNDKTDNQDNFGLFTNDGTPKASATAIHNFTTILQMDTGSGPVDTVGYDLDNGNSNTHSVSLEKSDGVTALIIWQEEKVWDYNTLTDITVDPRTIHVTLDETVDTVDVYDPILGTQITAQITDTDEFDVQVTDHPIIMLIDL